MQDKSILSNSAVETMKKHSSVRLYDPNRSIPEEVFQTIIDAAAISPTSIHGQGYSLLRIKDPELRKQVYELSSVNDKDKQQHILDASEFLILLVDYYKAYLAAEKHSAPYETVDSLESLLVGAGDTGILLGHLIVAAESVGVSTVPIGAVRNKIDELSEILHLPKYVIPWAGLCLGYPKSDSAVPPVKPRFPKEGFLMDNVYQADVVKKALEKYDPITEEFAQKTIGNAISWSKRVSNFYSRRYYPRVDEYVLRQGFLSHLAKILKEK